MTETRAAYVLPALLALALELPSASVTVATRGGRCVTLVLSDWCDVIRAELAAVTDGDLDRLIALGAMAAEEQRGRWGKRLEAV